MTQLTTALLDAYHATTYRIDYEGQMVTFRVGVPAPAVDQIVAALHGTSWIFISAGNPYSQLLPERENQQRHALLIQMLTVFGHRFWEGLGIPDGTEWPVEQSLFILDMPLPKASALGHIFDQNSYIFGRIGEPPRFIHCD